MEKLREGKDKPAKVFSFFSQELPEPRIEYKAGWIYPREISLIRSAVLRAGEFTARATGCASRGGDVSGSAFSSNQAS